mgnify:CR=1 FL=1|jgi:hypothetical protein|tara:strand:+ start:262 stop:690 length:429 start_codon:yes stop_codon:yes gene_type:complete
MLSPQEAFKLGFLSKCVEQGLTVSQMRAEVKKASDELDLIEKEAVFDWFQPERREVWDTIGNLAETAGTGVLGALALGPPAAGAAAGILHSQLSDVDEEDVEDVKKRELVDEYLRQAEKLRQSARMREHRDSRKKRPGGLYL